MEKSVFIDAGHGGVDAGCPMGAGEKYYNLGVALRLRKVLEERGYKVGMSRLGDKSVSLKERCQKANAFYQQNGGIFVSIHHNAAEDEEACGIETYYYGGSAAGKALAEKVTKAAEKYSPVYAHRLRGEKVGSHLYVLRHTKAPAILVECEFLSNPHRLLWINKHLEVWFTHMAMVIEGTMRKEEELKNHTKATVPLYKTQKPYETHYQYSRH